MRRSHAQDLLNKTTYTEGASVQDHIKLLRTRKAAVNNLSATAMNDETWRGIIIRSIPPTPTWLPVIPSLYTLTSPADIISNLLAHSMILDRGHENPSNVVLTARGKEECTNPNCKARIRSTHTTENCYWPGGGKEDQFPPNFGQRSKANSATLTTQHFALSAWISKQRRTSITVSMILIEDPDDVSHHTSLTMEDNAIRSMIVDGDNTATLDIGITFTPDITPLSIISANPTELNLGNVPVEGERENLDEQVNQEDNQPLPQLDEPEPGPDEIDQPTTQHIEEDSTEVENREPIDGNDPIPTEYDVYLTLTDSFLEGGAGHKTAVTPGTNAQPEEKGQSRGKDDSGEEGKGVDEVDWGITTVDERPKEVGEVGEDRENMEGTRRPTGPGFPDFEPEPVHLNSSISDERIVDLEQTECSCGDPRKNNPQLQKALEDPAERPKVYPGTADDAESVPHPYTDQFPVQSNFDDIKSISRPMDLENTLTEGQHGSSRAKIKTTNNLPFREGIGSLTPTPKSCAEEGKGVDENDDEADWATTNTTNEAQGRHRANPVTAERREVNPEKGDAKSNPQGRDDAKSNPKEADDAKSNPLPQPGFGGAEHILMPMDQNMTLSKGQHPYTNLIPVRLNFDLNVPLPTVQYLPTVANIKETTDVPHHKDYGATMHAPTGTSTDVVFATSTTTRFIEDIVALHSEAIQCVVQPTKGIEACEDEEKYAPMGTKVKIPPSIAITDEFLEEPPQISSDQSRGGGGASWINPRKHREGPIAITTQFSGYPRIGSTDVAFTIAIDTMTAEIFTRNLEDLGGMHSNATKHVFRDLEGMGGINSVKDDKRNDLPVFGDVGEEPQHRKGNHTPKIYGRTVPWINPREQDLSTRSTTTEEDEVSTVGMRTWPCGPLDPFGKYSHRYPGSTNELIASYITEHGGRTGPPPGEFTGNFSGDLCPPRASPNVGEKLAPSPTTAISTHSQSPFYLYSSKPTIMPIPPPTTPNKVSPYHLLLSTSHHPHIQTFNLPHTRIGDIMADLVNLSTLLIPDSDTITSANSVTITTILNIPEKGLLRLWGSVEEYPYESLSFLFHFSTIIYFSHPILTPFFIYLLLLLEYRLGLPNIVPYHYCSPDRLLSVVTTTN